MRLEVGTVVMFNFTYEALCRLIGPHLSGSLRSPDVSQDFRVAVIHQAGVLAMGRLRSAIGLTSAISGVSSGKIVAGSNPSLVLSYRVTGITGEKRGDKDVSYPSEGGVEISLDALARAVESVPGLSISISGTEDFKAANRAPAVPAQGIGPQQGNLPSES